MTISYASTIGENNYASEIRSRISTNESISAKFVDHLVCLHSGSIEFSAADFDQFELEEVFAYLTASHAWYLDRCLPKIYHTLEQLRMKSGKNSITVGLLVLFLDKYRNELEKHIRYEEQVLFSFVHEFLKGNYEEEKKEFVLQHFLTTHNDHIILHLDQLQQDMVKLEVDLQSNLIFSVLFHQLQIFQSDLEIHSRIEDDVFIAKLLTRLG